jgi:dolichyl-phosphate-mannose-protein mannosyltransferase
VVLIFTVLAFSVLFLTIYIRWVQKAQDMVLSETSSIRPAQVLTLMLWLGMAARLWIAFQVKGYDVDVGTFKAWAGTLAAQGFSNFYQEGVFSDYPPGYMYVLYLIGAIRNMLDIPFESSWFTLILKLPAIAADLIVSVLLYRWGKRLLHPALAVSISLLYWLSPAVLVNSAAWGQVDSFFMLWTLLFLHDMEKGKLEKASFYYAISLLVKPQALLLGPLVLCVFIRGKAWGALGKSLLIGLGTFILFILPFVIHKGPLFIVELYFGTLASYPYASLNAYNLMALFGGNFVDINGSMLILSYKLWGTILLIGAYAYGIYLYFKSNRSSGSATVIAFLLITSVFMLFTKMHERYLFYSLPLLLLSYIYIRDRRLLHVYAVLTVTSFLNVGQVLVNSMHKIYHTPPADGLLMLVSLVNVIAFVYICWLVRRIVTGHETLEWAVSKDKKKRPQPSRKTKPSVLRHSEEIAVTAEVEEKPSWTRVDTLLLSGLIAVYTCLAFINLGSNQAPETVWAPKQAGETVIVDFGEVQQVHRLNSYAGIGEGKLQLSWSTDAKQWSEAVPLEFDVYKVFSWREATIEAQARYAKLVVDRPGFSVYEAAFFNKVSEVPIQLSVLDAAQGTTSEGAAYLFDESHKAAVHPTFMNGTYFDEIYHARTAFEHLNQIEPYENTHPPLGKVLISIGIYLFGMNPFGWRIIGTLIGIAMIPIMYMFGKRLFKRTEYAFVSALLISFDCLHFVQTRIATIDVYGVFFILLMFYFMYRLFESDMFGARYRTSLIPLALSGLFFGMGVASKWIGLYAGVGLAVLYFMWLFNHYRVYEGAGKQLRVRHRGAKADVERLERIVSVFPRRAVISIAWCIIWFVAVPLMIYVASYIPFMQVPGPGHGLRDVWSYQKHMLSYHSQLVATHPFSSTWWQWPAMVKPVWYYSGGNLPSHMISSISAIGNPLVWWTGFIAVIAMAIETMRTRSKTSLFILIAFFSQYVPWMLVPRVTFIYHYFAMVPFSILAIVHYYKQLKESAAVSHRLLYGYLAAVVLVFFMFYPVLSGLETSRWYAESFLRWFQGWIIF